MNKGRPTLCVECGPRVEIDGDGCCVTCGNGATGSWLDSSHSCTCDHGDASAPIVKHDKGCPIRVNLRKRIAPEVALDRLARALDAGEELDEIIADRDCLAKEFTTARAQLHAIACMLHEACDLASVGMYSGGRLRDEAREAAGRVAGFRRAAHEITKHDEHGRGTEADGPDGSDCPCRTTTERPTCAAAGCGFCCVAEPTL